MRQLFVFILVFIFFPFSFYGQSIFENTITGTNPDESNPYNIGQIVDPDITVTGIGRGSGIFGINSNDRYNARSWKSDVLDPNAYFEFTVIPNAGKKIDFVSFEYTGQISVNGPTLFVFRSSVDGFTTDIGSVSATGASVSLSDINFQNITSSITFRLYGWAALTGTGTFSINDFEFNGIVSCATPQIPALPETIIGCSSTSFELNWSASSNASNYFIDVATDSGFVTNLTDYQNKDLGNTLSETVVGLTAGKTYYVRLRSANNCEISANSNTIKVAPPETVYNGAWSNGTPDANKNIRFSDDFNMDTSFEACSCQIDDGVAVHVDSGVVFKLENSLDVQGSGALTFEDSASLVQVNDGAVNTGKIIYKRITAPMKNFDFTYWSSPVKDQVLKDLSPNTLWDKYFSFANGNWVIESGTNTMNTAGKGFIIRVPKPNTVYGNGEYWTGATYEQPVQFTGVPYNGVITIPTQGIGMDNLIGNPYPSAIDADLFMANPNNASLINGALYFWTHNTAITQSGSFYVYNSDDYAVYTLTGGIGTMAAPSTGGFGAIPDGKIAAGQSFFVGSKAVGSFEFNNSMRVSDSGSNSQFFKMAKVKNLANTEKSRVWLSLTNSQGVFKQLLVGYIKGATNEMDNLYDGISFGGNKYVDFYSVNDGEILTIQGRGLPFLLTDKVPLGFKTTIDGAFEIKMDQVDGLLAKRTIYLEDKDAGILHDFKKGSYSFSTSKGEYNNRFVLRYLPNLKTILMHDIVANAKHQLEIYINESQLSLKSNGENLSAVFVYDLKGKLIFQEKNIHKQQFIISDLIPKQQILIVKTVFDNNASRTDKIIF